MDFRQTIRKLFPNFIKIPAIVDSDGVYVDPLEIYYGAPVMLTKNLDVVGGLANGTRGRVVDIIFDPTENSECWNGIVQCIVVDFEDYTGEDLVKAPRGDGVAIFRSEDKMYNESTDKFFRVKKFPLSLMYAMTFHKSQGQTLDRGCISLDEHEMSACLTYVALSRFKTFESIMILDSDEIKARRLTVGLHATEMVHREREERRLYELENGFKNCIK